MVDKKKTIKYCISIVYNHIYKLKIEYNFRFPSELYLGILMSF